MKPMTNDEIAHLKIWAEKQRTRRPAEILYEDILRLIATIENGGAQLKPDVERLVTWAQTPHHWERWEGKGGKCSLCGQDLTALIHMPQLPDQIADPSIIAKLNPQAGDLKSALNAIKPNLDPANQALIDALIEGEGK